MKISRVTSKYQATVPADVRVALGVVAGDRISWEVDNGGGVKVRRVEAVAVDAHLSNATLVDSALAGEWLSEEDEDLFRAL